MSGHPPLVCPACRHPPAASALDVHFACTGCGHRYEVLAGTAIPVVFGPDTEVVDDDHGIDLADEAAVRSWCQHLAPVHPAFEAAIRLGMYVDATARGTTIAPSLVEWLATVLDAEPATVLDVGCGTGAVASAVAARWPSAAVTALDAWAPAVRAGDTLAAGTCWVPRLEGTALVTRAHDRPSPADLAAAVRWVVADACAPPLPAGTFDVVILANLLDTVSDGALALGQAAALTAPGGCLIVAQPDAWNTTTTSPDAWFDRAAVLNAVADRGMEVTATTDDLVWHLDRTSRARFAYRSWAVALSPGRGSGRRPNR